MLQWLAAAVQRQRAVSEWRRCFSRCWFNKAGARTGDTHQSFITQCEPKDILNLDEAALCDMQPKRPLALKSQKCHGRKEYKDRMTILCSDADGSENLHSVIVSKFEKPYCLKGKRHGSCDYKLSTNVWMATKSNNQLLALVSFVFRDKILKHIHTLKC